MARERSQLVVSLGSGAEGVRKKRVLQAALRARMLLSDWVRQTLLMAAGERSETVTREEFDELGLRVSKIERYVDGEDE